MKFGKLLLGLLVLSLLGVFLAFLYVKLSPKNIIAVKEDHYAITLPTGWVQYDIRAVNYDDIHASRSIFISKKGGVVNYAHPINDVLEIVTMTKFRSPSGEKESQKAYFEEQKKTLSDGNYTIGGHEAFKAKKNYVEHPTLEYDINGKDRIYRVRFYSKNIDTSSTQKYFFQILSSMKFL